ncbi:flagellar biosynthesis protein FlhF [Nitrospira sp. Kam-Ns4a]
MKIKTFQALTMQDALRTIKAELGPDAVILSTKQVRRGGALFGLFGRPLIEVAAAVDFEPASQEGAAPRFERELRRSVARKPTPEECPGAAPPPGRGPDASWTDIRAELAQIRTLLEAVTTGGGRVPPMPRDAQGAAGLSPPLQAARDRLVRAGLSASTALQLAAGMAERGRLCELDSEAKIRAALERLLVRETKTGGPLLALGEWKKTVMLVGPTGVGKTTTIAKLAAHYHVKERRAVALVTMDTYRVAAVEQLRLFAQTIGVPLDVALTKEEMVEFVRRRAKAELILIDTPGRNPLDPDSMEELRRTVTTDHPLEIHLVLSATTRDEDLLDAVDRYAALPINRLLFTKLDETTRYGAPFELMRRTGWALSYFSTGQHVPEDLELVRPERMAELVLGGALRARPGAHERAAPAAPPQPAKPEARAAGARVAKKGGAWWTRW